MLLAALVTGLLAGLIAMHHLSTGLPGPHGTAMAASDAQSVQALVQDPDAGMQRDEMRQDGTQRGTPPPAPHADAGILHLCLAILTGFAIVIAAMTPWRRGTTPALRSSRRPAQPVPAPRAPPPSAPARLALLCVLRT